MKQLWQHAELRLKDHVGHHVHPIDLDRVGIDEIIVSHLALDASGKILWRNPDSHYPDNQANHTHYRGLAFAGNPTHAAARCYRRGRPCVILPSSTESPVSLCESR